MPAIRAATPAAAVVTPLIPVAAAAAEPAPTPPVQVIPAAIPRAVIPLDRAIPEALQAAAATPQVPAVRQVTQPVPHRVPVKPRAIRMELIPLLPVQRNQHRIPAAVIPPVRRVVPPTPALLRAERRFPRHLRGIFRLFQARDRQNPAASQQLVPAHPARRRHGAPARSGREPSRNPAVNSPSI
jgi:hypothetical protein